MLVGRQALLCFDPQGGLRLHLPIGYAQGVERYRFDGGREFLSLSHLIHLYPHLHQFQDAVGRYDLAGGDRNQLFDSIHNLYAMNLDNDTYVIHGHGMDTTIGWLKENNPWFKRAQTFKSR